MSYAELADLTTYLKITTDSDDVILTDALDAATQAIDNYCGRRFVAVTATRYYTAADLRHGVLWLDDDLLTVTTLLNGDASVLTSSYYWLDPRNSTPKHAIRLRSTAYWNFATDGEIAVTGTWGYSATPDDLIRQACLWLASYFYHLKDSQVFDVTATPELGQITIPKGMPQQLVVHLASLRRRSL
jgi:hypothetical protein